MYRATNGPWNVGSPSRVHFTAEPEGLMCVLCAACLIKMYTHYRGHVCAVLMVFSHPYSISCGRECHWGAVDPAPCPRESHEGPSDQPPEHRVPYGGPSLSPLPPPRLPGVTSETGVSRWLLSSNSDPESRLTTIRSVLLIYLFHHFLSFFLSTTPLSLIYLYLSVISLYLSIYCIYLSFTHSHTHSLRRLPIQRAVLTTSPPDWSRDER